MVAPLTSVYVVAPALIVGAVVALGLTLRWILAGDAPVSRGPKSPTCVGLRRGPVPDDYGLLRAAALVDDFDTGQSVRALLAAARVRATVATGRDGLVRVLVFPAEYDRARRLVSWAL
jgi:hypothetical protein